MVTWRWSGGMVGVVVETHREIDMDLGGGAINRAGSCVSLSNVWARDWPDAWDVVIEFFLKSYSSPLEIEEGC